MHVLHVASLRNAAGGGLISSLIALQKSFDRAPNGMIDKSRVKFSVLLPQSSSNFPWVATLQSCGIAVYFANSDVDVVRAIVRLKPSIVHTHFVQWQVPAAIGASMGGARLFFHLHSGAQVSKATSLLARVKYLSMRHAVERYICVSPDIAAYIGKHGVPAARIAEIPNGVDLDVFHSPTNEQRERARKKFGIDDASQPVVAFFGRDAVIKGADRLAAAFAGVRHGIDVLCVASSRESIAVLSGNARIRVHDVGVVDDVREVFWAADVLALPSRIEALPFTVLEARATGLLVVASELARLRAFVDDPGTTLVADALPEDFLLQLERAARLGRVPLPVALAKAISLDRWAERVRERY